jgi:DNA-binding transcriptional regulator of glucitol operon
MKKLIAKLRKKDSVEPASRITNETVAEHREKILAGGRRFKYPVQYARHKLVFNAIIISVIAVIIIVVVGWWQLYPAQNTSTFVYRVTKVVPLPVASIDGQLVPYSDYLMRYQGAVHFLEQQEGISLKSEDGKRQIEFYKQSELQNAIDDAYALKLAREKKITVSDAELESTLKSQRQSTSGEISQATQEASILSRFGWSADEYRQLVKSALLRQKVEYAIDDAAIGMGTSLKLQVQALGSNFQSIVTALNAAKPAVQTVYGAPGWVPKTNQDGGLAAVAAGLGKGQVSEAVMSTKGDGYYFVRQIDSNGTQVSYEYIQIPLTEFQKKITALEKAKKIQRFITIAVTTSDQQQP